MLHFTIQVAGEFIGGTANWREISIGGKVYEQFILYVSYIMTDISVTPLSWCDIRFVLNMGCSSLTRFYMVQNVSSIGM